MSSSWDFPDEAPRAPASGTEDSPAQVALLEAVRASAGAGKTYALTGRYLYQLLRGAPPERILATTFTRKAAGEILERVLLRLADAALDPQLARRLAEELEEPGLDQVAFQNQLTRLCQSLHRVSISTIDAYFNRLATSFRLELGLPGEFHLVDEQQPRVAQLRLEALRGLLAGAAWEALTELVNQVLQRRASRGVAEKLDQKLQDLYQLYRQAPVEAWLQLPELTPLPDPELRRCTEVLHEELARIDKARLRNSLETALRAAERGEWRELFESGVGLKVRAGETKFGGVPIPPAVIAVFLRLLEHVRATVLQALRDENQALLRLLSEFDRHYAFQRSHTHTVLFSDLPLALARRMSDLDPELQAHRLDMPVTHLLLDEFQDTSPEQWAVLRPLARRIARRGGSVFVVGDTKQAIYGWRGGSAEIFQRLDGDLDALSWKSQSCSYRSSPVVLEIVNRVFAGLPENPALSKPEHSEAVRRFHQGFVQHEAARPLPGYVEMLEIAGEIAAEDTDSDSDSDAGDAAGESASGFDPFDLRVAQEIVRLAHSHPGMSIGVLTRTNPRVRSLLFLLQREGIQASGEGGNPVTDDPAVIVCLEAFRLADHPGDGVAAFRVLHSPLAPLLGMTRLEDAGKISEALRRAVLEQGFAGVLSSWLRPLSAFCTPRSVQRLVQLIELAEQFEPERTLRADDFVAFVGASRLEEPTPSRVRVMTIHKSKGLEFDLVVLTELHRGMLGQRPTVLVDRPDPAGPVRAIYPLVKQKLRALYEPLERAYQQHLTRELNEGLCELYVAMTRPRFALHLMLPESERGKGPGGPSAAAVLRGALRQEEWAASGAGPHSSGTEAAAGLCGAPPSDEGDGRARVVFAWGDRDWFTALRGSADRSDRASGAARAVAPDLSAHPPAGRRGELLAPTTRRRRGALQILPSDLERDAVVEVGELLGKEGSLSRVRGTLVHAWLARVGWLEGGGLEGGGLEGGGLEGGGPGRAELLSDPAVLASGRSLPWCEAELDRLLERLSAPGIRAALARPELREGESLELWRERSFVVRLGSRLLRGTFDRAWVVRREAEVLRAEVQDFKSDQVEAGQVGRRVKIYRPQLEAYRAALAALLQVDPVKIACRLIFLVSGTSICWSGEP